MAKADFKPFVPADSDLAEFTEIHLTAGNINWCMAAAP